MDVHHRKGTCSSNLLHQRCWLVLPALPPHLRPSVCRVIITYSSLCPGSQSGLALLLAAPCAAETPRMLKMWWKSSTGQSRPTLTACQRANPGRRTLAGCEHRGPAGLSIDHIHASHTRGARAHSMRECGAGLGGNATNWLPWLAGVSLPVASVPDSRHCTYAVKSAKSATRSGLASAPSKPAAR